jgi:dTDP-4-amino-4,6-dideoxygalactose transaminase
MPAFHCGVEVQAAIDAGLNVGFYRIQSDLTLDFEDLAHKLSGQPGPVLVIHYFGLGQSSIESLAELCRTAGVTLIEDCAHSLFSRYRGRRLGDYAPISIFSLRKTLPLLEGGAVQIAAGGARPPIGASSLAAYQLYFKFAARACLGETFANAYRRWRWDADDSGSDPSPPNLEPDRYQDRMSALSRRLAAVADPERTVERRRSNWSALDALLCGTPGYCKVFETLPDGACPLFLPVWSADRRRLMKDLNALGVETFVFGAYPHPRLDTAAFPETARLRDEMLCLPIHDQLGEAQLRHIAAAFEAVSGTADR